MKTPNQIDPPVALHRIVMPSDQELESMVFRILRSLLNQEPRTISACMASMMKIDATDEFHRAIKKQLDRLVREKRIRRTRFLPGRPTYTIY